MSYPRIFERVYLSTLCVHPQRFASVHAFLLPALRGEVRLPETSEGSADKPDSATSPVAYGDSDRPLRDNRNSWDGKRAQKCRPGWRVNPMGGDPIWDHRFFYEPVPGVAVVPIYGALAKNLSAWEEACGGGTDITAIAEAFDQAAKDPGIHTILLDIDSPGGQSTGIPELSESVAAAVRESGKRVIAFSDGMIASAAYWIASQADEIYTTGSADVGSIGVYIAWLDPAIKMELEGIKLQFFHRGKHKGIGLPGRALSEEDEQLLEDRVAECYAQFTGAVKASRAGIPQSAMEGQCVTGQAMVENRLVDGLMSGWNEMLELASE